MELVQTFSYKGNDVSFDFSQKDVMINATDMAKAYGKDVFAFTRLPNVKKFAKTLSSKYGVPALKTSSGKNGITWMQRKLAVRFAAWLDADFEFWIYDKVEEHLFGNTVKAIYSMQEKKNKLAKLKAELRESSNLFNELEKLELELRQLQYKFRKHINNQIQLFAN